MLGYTWDSQERKPDLPDSYDNMISQTRKADIGIFEVMLRTESGRSAPGVY